MTEAGWTRGKDVKVEGWYWWEVEEETGLSLKVVQVEKGFTWIEIENEGRDVLYVVGYGGLLENKPGRFKGPITPDSYQQGWVEGLAEVERYMAMRLRLAEASLATEILAGNEVKQGRERAAIAELHGMQRHVSDIKELAQQAQEGGVGDVGK